MLEPGFWVEHVWGGERGVRGSLLEDGYWVEGGWKTLRDGDGVDVSLLDPEFGSKERGGTCACA